MINFYKAFCKQFKHELLGVQKDFSKVYYKFYMMPLDLRKTCTSFKEIEEKYEAYKEFYHKFK